MKSDIISHVVTTEKSVRLMESENKITVVTNIKATKNQIKKEVEDLFGVKVKKITVMITSKGLKKAYVQLSDEHSAMDIAAKFGLM